MHAVQLHRAPDSKMQESQSCHSMHCHGQACLRFTCNRGALRTRLRVWGRWSSSHVKEAEGRSSIDYSSGPYVMPDLHTASMRGERGDEPAASNSGK